MTDLRIEFFDVVILTHQAPIGGLAAHSARTHGISFSCNITIGLTYHLS